MLPNARNPEERADPGEDQPSPHVHSAEEPLHAAREADGDLLSSSFTAANRAGPQRIPDHVTHPPSSPDAARTTARHHPEWDGGRLNGQPFRWPRGDRVPGGGAP